MVKCIQLSTLQNLVIVSCFLLHVANSSVLACACSFPLCWRAVYCSGYYFCQQMFVEVAHVAVFHLLKRFCHKACDKLHQQHSQKNGLCTVGPSTFRKSTQQNKTVGESCFGISYYQSDQIIQPVCSSFVYMFGALEEENWKLKHDCHFSYSVLPRCIHSSV